MDWGGLIINVIAIFVGLAIYLLIANSKWGKEHSDMPYFWMLVALMGAVIVGGVLRWLIL